MKPVDVKHSHREERIEDVESQSDPPDALDSNTEETNALAIGVEVRCVGARGYRSFLLLH